MTERTEVCPQWVAIRTRSNREHQVAEALNKAGIEAFLPIYRERTRWSDRVKTVERCLFPGYLFAHLTPGEFADVDRIAGVVSLLPTSIAPIAIAPDEIDMVRKLANAPELVPCVYQPGEEVQIARGPLAGQKGVVKRIVGEHYVVLTIEILQRSVAVKIDPADLEAKK